MSGRFITALFMIAPPVLNFPVVARNGNLVPYSLFREPHGRNSVLPRFPEQMFSFGFGRAGASTAFHLIGVARRWSHVARSVGPLTISMMSAIGRYCCKTILGT